MSYQASDEAYEAHPKRHRHPAWPQVSFQSGKRRFSGPPDFLTPPCSSYFSNSATHEAPMSNSRGVDWRLQQLPSLQQPGRDGGGTAFYAGVRGGSQSLRDRDGCGGGGNGARTNGERPSSFSAMEGGRRSAENRVINFQRAQNPSGGSLIDMGSIRAAIAGSLPSRHLVPTPRVSPPPSPRLRLLPEDYEESAFTEEDGDVAGTDDQSLDEKEDDERLAVGRRASTASAAPPQKAPGGRSWGWEPPHLHPVPASTTGVSIGRAKTLDSVVETARVLKEFCIYCTPVAAVPGVLTLSPHAITFEPEPRSQPVREFGIGKFQVYIAVADIVACASSAIPDGPLVAHYFGITSPSLGAMRSNGNNDEASRKPGFFQLVLSTLDGRRRPHTVCRRATTTGDPARSVTKGLETPSSAPRSPRLSPPVNGESDFSPPTPRSPRSPQRLVSAHGISEERVSDTAPPEASSAISTGGSAARESSGSSELLRESEETNIKEGGRTFKMPVTSLSSVSPSRTQSFMSHFSSSFRRKRRSKGTGKSSWQPPTTTRHEASVSSSYETPTEEESFSQPTAALFHTAATDTPLASASAGDASSTSRPSSASWIFRYRRRPARIPAVNSSSDFPSESWEVPKRSQKIGQPLITESPSEASGVSGSVSFPGKMPKGGETPAVSFAVLFRFSCQSTVQKITHATLQFMDYQKEAPLPSRWSPQIVAVDPHAPPGRHSGPPHHTLQHSITLTMPRSTKFDGSCSTRASSPPGHRASQTIPSSLEKRHRGNCSRSADDVLQKVSRDKPFYQAVGVEPPPSPSLKPVLLTLTSVPYSSDSVLEAFMLSPRSQAAFVSSNSNVQQSNNATDFQLPPSHFYTMDNLEVRLRNFKAQQMETSRPKTSPSYATKPGDSGEWLDLEEEKVTGNSKRVDSYSPMLFAPLSIERLQGAPVLMTDVVAAKLASYLPPSLSIRVWRICFCTKVHGISFQTLYRKAGEQSGPCLVLIRDTRGTLFGGYSPVCLHESPHYYGTGETFVFTFKKEGEEDCEEVDESAFKVYPWSSKNSFFVFSDLKCFAFGGGGSFALTVDSNFLRGSSSPCATFSSPGLASTNDFLVKDFQVFRFGDP